MDIAKSNFIIEGTFLLKLSEEEAEGLAVMCQYGATPYIEWAKRNLSKREFETWKRGITSLVNAVRSELPYRLKEISDARKTLNETRQPKPKLNNN